MSGIRLALLANLLLPCGCDRDPKSVNSSGPDTINCTLIGREDGLFVSVSPLSAWPHGSYRFTIEHDDVTTVCTGDLPLLPCGQPSLTCDGTDLTIVESGCAIDPAQHAFGEIHLPHGPAQVTVTVELDDVTLASESYTPEYQTYRPNGPGCPPECTNAVVELSLSFE